MHTYFARAFENFMVAFMLAFIKACSGKAFPKGRSGEVGCSVEVARAIEGIIVLPDFIWNLVCVAMVVWERDNILLLSYFAF